MHPDALHHHLAQPGRHGRDSNPGLRPAGPVGASRGGTRPRAAGRVAQGVPPSAGAAVAAGEAPAPGDAPGTGDPSTTGVSSGTGSTTSSTLRQTPPTVT